MMSEKAEWETSEEVSHSFNLLPQVRLLTQAEFFNQSTVTFDVTGLQVVEQRTAFAYQHGQSSFSTIILSVELHVLSQTSNTVGKQCYLRLNRSGISVRLSVLAEDFLLFSSV